MVKQFIVHLMSLSGVVTHVVNCANKESAQHICEGIFSDARVIDITEVS